MKYVMSDIHGMYDKFIAMLKAINFSDEDILYINGDVVDRGPEPLLILDYIMSHKNIIMIRGNHELMMVKSLSNNEFQMWYMNGGTITHDKIRERGQDYQEQLIEYINKLPNIIVVDNYILVHAGLYLPLGYNKLTLEELLEEQSQEFNLWDRSNLLTKEVVENYRIICGHSPVQSIIMRHPAEIIHTEGHTYIDCGAVYKHINGKLACFCLDTREEFYI